MKIEYTETASNSLYQLINFIEDKNTSGAGLRWLNKYELFLNNSFLTVIIHKKCNNSSLRDLGLYCLSFNDWVIAYSLHEDLILIESLLYKSRIVD